MKKAMIFLLFVFVTGLSSCTNQTEDINIIVPEGIPAIAQSKMEHDENFKIERVSGPQPLSASFSSESHEIIIAPINLGANWYSKSSSYKLAAILTWNNLQIISKTKINSIFDLTGQEVIGFGEGAIPEMIISHLFSNISFDNPPTIDYTSTSTQQSLLSFLHEYYYLDLIDLLKNYTDVSNFPQAGVFVNHDLSEQKVNAYLDALELSQTFVLSNPKTTASYCFEMNYPFEESVIEESIPFSQINFVLSKDIVDDLDQFFELIFDFKPELIGGVLPDESFYW